MRRQLKRVGGELVLPLTTAELAVVGADGEGPAAVLVKMEAGPPARIVISRAPTFDEAMEAVFRDHREVFVRLAAMPDAGGKAPDGGGRQGQGQ